MTRQKTMTIAPVEGRTLPLEGSARRHLVKPTTVANTLYYRRALKRGDCQLEQAPASRSKSKPKAESSDS